MKSYLLATTMLALGVGLPSLALAQAQPAAPAQSPAAKPADDTTTVVVTGFRSSLQKSLNLKKDAIVVRDSIVAEDIGKFPDANVADALQRIPGVALNRDGPSNEGQTISIRGLGPQYAVATLNGAPVHTTSSSNVGSSVRNFNYDVFASELFGRVDFYKTPLAELEEGGIGGVVDLQTPRPFDSPGRVIRYTVSAAYNDASKKTDPSAFVLYSNTWGDWGLLMGYAHSTAVNFKSGFEATGGYNSSFRSNNAVVTNPTTGGTGTGGFNYTLDYQDPRANLGSYTQSQVDNAFLPRFYRYYGAQNTRHRDGLVTSIEYKHDKVDFSLDLLGSDLKDARDEFTFGLPIRNSATSATGRATQPNGWPTHNGLVPINVHIDPATNLMTGTFGNTDYLGESYYYNDETKFGYAALNGKYQMTDTLRITGQVAVSDSDAVYTDNKVNSNIYGVTTTIDYTGNHVYPALSAPGVDFTNPATYGGSTLANDFQAAFDWNREIDKEKTARLVADYDYNLPFSWVGHLKSGLEYTDTTKQKIKVNDTPVGTAAIAALGISGMESNMLHYVPIDNLKIGSGYPQEWATFSRSFVDGTLGALGNVANTPRDLSTSFQTSEIIKTFFVESDFKGQVFDRELRINAGERFSSTTTQIDNYLKQTNGSVTTYAPNHIMGGYNNALPSFSAAYDLTPKLIWRASWGKTITRAPLSIIAANTVIPNVYNAYATSGNPDLKPQLSDNKDTGLEWYFAKGGLLSAGFFWKDLTDTTVSTTTTVPFSSLGLPDSALGAIFIDPVTGHVDPNLQIQLATYYNSGEIKYRGEEYAYQQSFGFLPGFWSGFGALASYTHIHTSGYNYYRTTDGKAFPISDVPKYSYSLTGYYEKGPYAIRLSYNYKGAYAIETSNQGNDLERLHDGAGFLDSTISYKINPSVEIRLDGQNLLNTLQYDYFNDVTGKYGNGKGTRMDYAKYDGRVIKLVVRGKF